MIHTLDTSRATPVNIGGKGRSWWAVALAGISVPDGFVVPHDATLGPTELADALAALAARTGATRIAVRSSAEAEDGATAAFAGLFESVLDVPADPTAVADAIETCRNSGRSARVRSALGEAVNMAVLVQEMVDPDTSGLLFTKDPRGIATGMIIEAVEGHLVGLVDGAVTPDRYVLSREDYSIAPPALAHSSRLLRDAALRLEEVLAGPVDIEWAIQNDNLIVLQARPITTLHDASLKGISVVPVELERLPELPREIQTHDKLALRVLALRHGLNIASGLVAVANAPSPSDVTALAFEVQEWGEFIAVLLSPFDLDGRVFRVLATGSTATSVLTEFVESIAARHSSFSFLLKPLQTTVATGAATQRERSDILIELTAGHFHSKGLSAPTSYVIDGAGAILEHTPGTQREGVDVKGGQSVRFAVENPPTASPAQLAAMVKMVNTLSRDYPLMTVEFGIDDHANVFLIDVDQTHNGALPTRANVLSTGRIVGVVRVFDESADTLAKSIDRHAHSRRVANATSNGEPTILVVRRPFHTLDQEIYDAAPGTLGFICEGGALLCHLATVMREYGVPGVICPGATRDFNDGDRVILDTRPGSGEFIRRL